MTSADNSSAASSTARVGGCWIGLSMDLNTNSFQWNENVYTSPTPQVTAFRDWRRAEPNNHTYSEGQSTNGELCTIVVPWQNDPLIVEQGSWNDVACKLMKAYVCETTRPTNRFQLVVTGTATLLGGAFEGGILTLQAQSLLGGYSFFRSAIVKFNMPLTTTATIVDSLPMHDGSSMLINARIIIRRGLYIGENPPFATYLPYSESLVGMKAVSSQLGIMPQVIVSSTGSITLDSSCAAWTPTSSELYGFGGTVPACMTSYNVSLNSMMIVNGNIIIGNNVQFILTEVLFAILCSLNRQSVCKQSLFVYISV